MHELVKDKGMKASLIIELTGEKGGNRSTLEISTIKPMALKSVYDFSYVFSKVDPAYKNLQLEFKAKDKMIMINAQLSVADPAEVERGEITYFSINKGDKLDYKLNP